MDRKPRILIVDDEPLNLDYLEQELEDLDCEVLTAGNGQEALEVVARSQPDLILLDIMMPVMDGFTVLTRLKNDSTWRDIPVIIISASSDIDNIVKGIELGAEDFLPKPFNPVLLHARLKAGLEKKRLRDLETLYRTALERELEIGKNIQAGFLPTQVPQPDGWEISTFFRAAREVAGDFYDIFEFPDGKVGIILGDVTDKGVGSALYMALFRSLLRAATLMDLCGDDEPVPDVPALDLPDEDRILRAVSLTNDYICRVHQSAMFATLFFGVLDPHTGELCYVNAGHDHPYLLRQGKIHATVKTTGPIVGFFEDAEFKIEGLQLEQGDQLVLYSDGIPDVQGNNGEVFGRKRFEDLLIDTPTSASDTTSQIIDQLDSFVDGNAQYDDITLVVVRKT
jgi:serine phosphatase RsbU (regulator of sigma subunit)